MSEKPINQLPIDDESIRAINILINEISKKHKLTFDKIIETIQTQEENRIKQEIKETADEQEIIGQGKTISEEDKEENTPNKEKTEKTETEHPNNNLAESENKNKIPTSIFSYNAGYLELISGYCHDLLGMPIAQVAKATNRDQRTIWSSYHNLKEKHPNIFKKEITKKKENKDIHQDITEAENTIPLNIFSDRNYSTFENLLLHLEKTQSTKQIAAMLGKNYKTIWTVLARARRKAR